METSSDHDATHRSFSAAMYGSYEWYKFHCQELATKEWEAHDQKRQDYHGDPDNIFWMLEDISNDSGLDQETIWIAWSTRHFRSLIRALRNQDYKIAAKRALDLMGWLFLLLAYLRRFNTN